MEIYFSQTSVIYFCRGFSCCAYYRGARKARVDCILSHWVTNDEDAFLTDVLFSIYS